MGADSSGGGDTAFCFVYLFSYVLFVFVRLLNCLFSLERCLQAFFNFSLYNLPIIQLTKEGTIDKRICLEIMQICCCLESPWTPLLEFIVPWIKRLLGNSLVT